MLNLKKMHNYGNFCKYVQYVKFPPYKFSNVDIRQKWICTWLYFDRNNWTTVKSRNYESRNNELSRYNEVGRGDAVMQVSIEKSRYNELSSNNEVNSADRGPS